jgi:hypothetical protein
LIPKSSVKLLTINLGEESYSRSANLDLRRGLASRRESAYSDY